MIVRIEDKVGYQNGEHGNQEKAFAGKIHAGAEDDCSKRREVTPPAWGTSERIRKPVTNSQNRKNQSGKHDAKTVGQPSAEINENVVNKRSDARDGPSDSV